MATDRIVYWKKNGKRPTRAQVEKVTRQFFDGAAKVEWNEDRFFVTLPGKWSHPLQGIIPGLLDTRDLGANERWIEVIPSRGCLDVLTRMQDEYTNTLAGGLAHVFVRCWDGELDE